MNVAKFLRTFFTEYLDDCFWIFTIPLAVFVARWANKNQVFLNMFFTAIERDKYHEFCIWETDDSAVAAGKHAFL